MLAAVCSNVYHACIEHCGQVPVLVTPAACWKWSSHLFLEKGRDSQVERTHMLSQASSVPRPRLSLEAACAWMHVQGGHDAVERSR